MPENETDIGEGVRLVTVKQDQGTTQASTCFCFSERKRYSFILSLTKQVGFVSSSGRMRGDN